MYGWAGLGRDLGGTFSINVCKDALGGKNLVTPLYIDMLLFFFIQ